MAKPTRNRTNEQPKDPKAEAPAPATAPASESPVTSIMVCRKPLEEQVRELDEAEARADERERRHDAVTENSHRLLKSLLLVLTCPDRFHKDGPAHCKTCQGVRAEAIRMPEPPEAADAADDAARVAAILKSRTCPCGAPITPEDVEREIPWCPDCQEGAEAE